VIKNFKIETNFEIDEIDIPKEKLVNYALNFDHPTGKDKALLFYKLLNITKKDWKFLAAQIYQGLSHAKFNKVRIGKHGCQFHTTQPVAQTEINTYFSLSSKKY
jgi:hypothetical protein